ncbi:MAG TPA: ABC transporter permease [Ilumatobacter sp.]|nr:ABC transporter permease [Ilumatobacter sp.]
MNATLSASQGIARRSLRNIRRLPSAFLPALLMPVFQVISFTGTYRGVTDIPGFPTERSANWFLPLAVVMGCSFAGMGLGFATIRDLESGFYDRLRMSPAPRKSLLLGGLGSALVRAAIAIVIVTIVGVALGARFTGGVPGVVALVVAGLGIATVGTFWALGLVYRLRDMRAAALMQLTLFFGLFLTEAQMPIPLMTGWLPTVARYNPLNQVLRLGRVGFVGDPSWSDAWPGLLTLAVLVSLAGHFARRGLATLDD